MKHKGVIPNASGFPIPNVNPGLHVDTPPTQNDVSVGGVITDEDVVRELAKLYKHLLENSEPLPPEDVALLYDNLWDLYG